MPKTPERSLIRNGNGSGVPYWWVALVLGGCAVLARCWCWVVSVRRCSAGTVLVLGGVRADSLQCNST